MTNLLEKALITGFGITILILFISIVIPFMNHLSEYNENERKALEGYMSFIDEMNSTIFEAIENPDENYVKNIEYPENLEIQFKNHDARFYFTINNQLNYKILEYQPQFHEVFYRNMLKMTLLLNISFIAGIIYVNITNLD